MKSSTKDALTSAANLGFAAVQLPAAVGETTPQSLSQTGRRHLARMVSGLGLDFAALDVNLSGALLADPGKIDEQLSKIHAILELARDLNVPRVSLAAGWNATAQAAESSAPMLAALAELANRTGTRLDLDIGASGAEAASHFRRLDCPLLRCCVDPARLIVAGQDVAESVARFADLVDLAYLRDARMGGGLGGQETALGEGHLDLVRYLAALEANGYGGPLILRRTDAANPLADLARAKELVEKIRR